MRRESSTPRPDWPAKVEALGLDFHTQNGEAYWWEEACYVFSSAEIDVIEEATETLHALCLEAVDRLLAAGDLGRLDNPARVLALDRRILATARPRCLWPLRPRLRWGLAAEDA
jgi:glutathionylspermidine synthase